MLELFLLEEALELARDRVPGLDQDPDEVLGGQRGEADARVMGEQAHQLAAGVAAGAEDGDIRIVTQNMYVGSSFDALSAAQTPQQFVAAVAAFYTKVLATRPAERAAAMALEIAQNRADLVALQ